MGGKVMKCRPLLQSAAALGIAAVFTALSGFVGFAGFAILATPADAAPAPRKRIGVSLLSQSHQFYRDLEDAIRSEAKNRDFDLMISYGEFDHVRQAEQIQSFIDKRVDALLIAPCNSNEVGVGIEIANRARIPVFTVDIANKSGRGQVVSHVASDNYDGGLKAGALMAEALGGRGKVVIINHPGVASVMERVRGFKDCVAQYPGLEVVSDIPGWGQRDRAMSIMEDLLLMYPEVDGVFAINDDSAMGVVTAIDAARHPRRIVVVGYDGTEEARRAIKAGKIYGDVVQYPRTIGELVVRTIASYFAGKPVEPEIRVGVQVIRASGL